MKFLITGDWQASSRNLDKIKQAAKREAEVFQEFECQTMIDLGDLKEPYNPFDGRLGLAQQDRLSASHWRSCWNAAIVVGGNHDRFSQNNNEETWFPLLTGTDEGGPTFYTEPAVRQDFGVNFYILPYHGDVDVLRQNAATLAKRAAQHREMHAVDVAAGKIHKDYAPKDFVLLFHCDLTQADYGGHSISSVNALSVADLQLDKYDYAFGGHVHKPQAIIDGEAYYVGSPFCMDWGEVNQQKRFLIYEVGKGVKSVPVGLPGFYDWDVAKDMEPDELEGCTVRLRVKAKDGAHYKILSRKRQQQFAKKFPKAFLHTVPEYEETEVTDYTFTEGNDQEKVTKYIEQKHDGDKVLTDYVIKVLEQASSVRSLNTQGLRFLHAKAHNYTSFEDVKFDYRKGGVIVINGQNEDWPGRSNGSGKSNLLDLPKVAMFGETGKEQTADEWASDSLTGMAWAQLAFRNAQGQRIDIERTRKPVGLSVKVDGVDQSSGLTGREKYGSTQALIRELSGYDLRMLTNAVYIDQERAHKFLTGTRKEKSELLYKFQGLERFELARDLVAAEIKTYKLQSQEAEKELIRVEANRDALSFQRIEALETHQKAIRDYEVIETEVAELTVEVTKLAPEYTRIETQRETTRTLLRKNSLQANQLTLKVGHLTGKLQAEREQVAQLRQGRKKNEQVVALLTSKLDEDAYKQAEAEIEDADQKLQRIENESLTLSNKLAELRIQAAAIQKQLDGLGAGKCEACGRDFDNAKQLRHQKTQLTEQLRQVYEYIAANARAIQKNLNARVEIDTTAAENYIGDYARSFNLRATAQAVLDGMGDPAEIDARIALLETELESETGTLEQLRRAVADGDRALADTAEIVADYTRAYDKLQSARTHKAKAKMVVAGAAERAEGVEAAYSAQNKVLEGIALRFKELEKELLLRRTAITCLERTGIPAYLCGLLCPALTKSAEHYATLFADEALQVVFEFVDGEFDCRVINGQGSNEIKGLSTGEKATASLITAFALRSAAPQTNLLILDEPGRGLDELGQRQFAKALTALRAEFETVLVTTHEKAMESSLEADKTLTVVKKDRVSRVN